VLKSLKNDINILCKSVFGMKSARKCEVCHWVIWL